MTYYERKEQKNMELVNAWLWASGIIIVLVVLWRLAEYVRGIL